MSDTKPLTPEQKEAELDSLFASPYAKMIYALSYVSHSGTQNQLLGLTLDIAYDEEKIQAWHNSVSEVLHEGGARVDNAIKHSHIKARQRLSSLLDSLYELHESLLEEQRQEELRKRRRAEQ